MLVGFCLANGQIWPWLVGAFFLWFWYPPAISYEDSKLEKIFGDAWREWSARTPALIPTKFSAGGSSENHWSFAKSLRANLEPVIVIYALACLWWLWRQLPAA
jgi:protein-S-isoprenylcysteine O-methyltransferase Ste14